MIGLDVTGDKWSSPQWSIGTYGRSPGQKQQRTQQRMRVAFFVYSTESIQVILYVRQDMMIEGIPHTIGSMPIKIRKEDMNMKIALGSDHAGLRLKVELKPFIESLGYEVIDVGCNCADSVDYPDYALEACQKVISGEAAKAILICGTGVGMSIAANKIPGIRCALIHDTFSAIATREHNDSNVLAMGERVIGPGLAQDIVKLWLGTEFSQGERHKNRVSKITALEEKYSLHP